MVMIYRHVFTFMLISFSFIFVLFNVVNTTVEPADFKVQLSRTLAKKNEMWPHRFIQNFTCEPFLNGKAGAKEVDELKGKWNYSDDFFFDQIDMDDKDR